MLAITQVSPANTNPTLTRGPKPDDAPQRVWPTYMRVAAPTTSRARSPPTTRCDGGSVFVIHEKKTGQGLAERFSKRFEEKGGKVSGPRPSTNDRDFGAVVTQVISAKPDMVFYGGEYPAAGPGRPAEERLQGPADGRRRHLRLRLQGCR